MKIISPLAALLAAFALGFAPVAVSDAGAASTPAFDCSEDDCEGEGDEGAERVLLEEEEEDGEGEYRFEEEEEDGEDSLRGLFDDEGDEEEEEGEASYSIDDEETEGDDDSRVLDEEEGEDEE